MPTRVRVEVRGVLVEAGRVLDEEVGAVPHAGALLREVFVPAADWQSTTWISADGDIYQRSYNAFTREWTFGARRSGAVDADGELVVCVGSGGGAGRVRLVRALALAWVEPPRASEALVAVQLCPSEPVTAQNVGWLPRAMMRASRDGVHAAREHAVSPPRATEGRVPRLCREWAAGEVERFVLHGYVLDDRGRLEHEHRGPIRPLETVWGGRRFALPEGSVGVGDLVACTFGVHVASCSVCIVHGDEDTRNCSLANLRVAAAPRRSRALAANVLALWRQECSVDEIAARAGVCTSTVWQRLDAACEAVRDEELDAAFWCGVVRDARVREGVALLFDARHAALGGPLGGLATAIFGEGVGVLTADELGELRLARQHARRTLHAFSGERAHDGTLAWQAGAEEFDGDSPSALDGSVLSTVELVGV